MDELTATQLRSELFKVIERVLAGFPVRIKTKLGKLILMREVEGEAISRSRLSDLMKVKADGRIIGDLKDADKALREHLNLPE